MTNTDSACEPQELFVVNVPEGTAMIDTGCRAAVGGSRWHAELQSALHARGKKFRKEIQEEYFQFGPGDPILSSRRWVYTVGILGEVRELVVSEVPVECPGLIGPDDLSSWGVTLDFKSQTYNVGDCGGSSLYVVDEFSTVPPGRHILQILLIRRCRIKRSFRTSWMIRIGTTRRARRRRRK